MSAKRGILCILLACVAVYASAQDFDTQLPTDVSAFTDQTVEFVVETLASAAGGRAVVIVEPFTTNGVVAPLGELLAVSISTRLANSGSRRLSVVDSAADDSPLEIDFVVTGRVFSAESAVMAVVQIVDAETREIFGGIESGFGMSPWVEQLMIVTTVAVSASGEDRFEPDSIDEPYVLSVGESVPGRTIAPEGDEDWYVFEAADLEGDNLLSVGTSGETDTYIVAYGPDPYTLLAENDDSSDQNAKVAVVVRSGDVVWIKVTGYDESTTGSYSLFSSLETFEGDALEPNNSRDEASMLIVNDEPISSLIMPGSDEDWYYFDLQRAGGGSTIISVETTGDLDTYLELTDESGAPVLENDDGGQDGNARIDVFLEEPGRYFVKVRQYDGSDQGEYGVGVKLIQATPDQWEPDDSRQEAKNISADGSQQVRNFTPADEADWASFSLQATRTAEIQTTGNIDTYIRLYDRLGNLVAEDDDSGNDYNARIERVLQRGTYFIEMTQIEGDSVFGGEYSLSVRAN